VSTVENQSLVVKYDDVEGAFSVVEKNSGAVFMKSGKLGLTNASAKVKPGGMMYLVAVMASS
jgi:hypothetical protein